MWSSQFGIKAGLTRHLNSCKVPQSKSRKEGLAETDKTDQKLTSQFGNHSSDGYSTPLTETSHDPQIWGAHTFRDLSQIFSAVYNEITKSSTYQNLLKSQHGLTNGTISQIWPILL